MGPIDRTTMVLVALTGAFLLILLVCSVIINVRGFVKKLRHIDREIQRAEPKEKVLWLRRRRRLWLSLLPFVRY